MSINAVNYRLTSTHVSNSKKNDNNCRQLHDSNAHKVSFGKMTKEEWDEFWWGHSNENDLGDGVGDIVLKAMAILALAAGYITVAKLDENHRLKNQQPKTIEASAQAKPQETGKLLNIIE